MLAIPVSGCFLKKTDVVKPSIVVAPPLTKILLPKEPPVTGSKIPRSRYVKLAPGKQQIVVSRGGGYFFSASNFNWLEWNIKARSYYNDLLIGSIKDFNSYVDAWNKKVKDLDERTKSE
jgi:hypothetical protein